MFWRLASYYFGMTILVVTNAYVFLTGGLDKSLTVRHAGLNIGAAILIAMYFIVQPQL